VHQHTGGEYDSFQFKLEIVHLDALFAIIYPPINANCGRIMKLIGLHHHLVQMGGRHSTLKQLKPLALICDYLVAMVYLEKMRTFKRLLVT
jgi:hypothetical protein